MSSIEAPCKTALEVDADLVEWALKVLEDKGLIKLIKIELITRIGFCHRVDIQMLYRWYFKSRR